MIFMLKFEKITGVGEEEWEPPHTEVLSVNGIHEETLKDELANTTIHVMESEVLVVGRARVLDPALNKGFTLS